jgi:hypothetical protein
VLSIHPHRQEFLMRKTLVFLCAAVFAGAPAAAQCIPVTFTSYGAPCGTGFPGALLTGTTNASTCTMTIDVQAFPGCCNSFQQSKIFVFGLQQTQLPVPGLPQPCFLLASPDFVIVQAAAVDGPTIPVPPQLFGLTIYAQGAVTYFTTIGFTTEIALTQGLQIDFF